MKNDDGVFRLKSVATAPESHPEPEAIGDMDTQAPIVQPQEAALVTISPQIQAEQLDPAIQKIVDAFKAGMAKLKSDYWAGMLTGAVIVLTAHYIFKGNRE